MNNPDNEADKDTLVESKYGWLVKRLKSELPPNNHRDYTPTVLVMTRDLEQAIAAITDLESQIATLTAQNNACEDTIDRLRGDRLELRQRISELQGEG